MFSGIRLTRSLFVLDTETTGTNEQTARIIDLGWQEFGPAGWVRDFQMYFNPGVPIPPGATKVHGITNEDLVRAPLFKTHAESIARVLSDCDFAGKHVRFDLKVLQAEFTRYGVRWEYGEQPERRVCKWCNLEVAAQPLLGCVRCGHPEFHTHPAVPAARIIDADRLEQIGEPRTLSDLYRKHIREACPAGCTNRGFETLCPHCFGEGVVPAQMIDAHSALDDVKGTAQVIDAQLRKYATIPRDLDALHALQWPGFIDTEGKFRFRDGVPIITFGKWRDTPMAEVERDYWRWLGGPKNDFGEEIKRIARAAARGEFPQPKPGVTDGVE